MFMSNNKHKVQPRDQGFHFKVFVYSLVIYCLFFVRRNKKFPVPSIRISFAKNVILNLTCLQARK